MGARFAGPVERRWVEARIAADVASLALRAYGDPVRAARAATRLASRTRGYAGLVGPTKLVHAGGRWYPWLVAAAWPGPTFSRWALAQLDALEPLGGGGADWLAMAMIAVTKRCPLACVHCSAGDELAARDTVPIARWIDLARRLSARGLSQLHLTGGEPMARYDDVLGLIGAVGRDTDVWLNTSGVGLGEARAGALAAAGLTGVVVSLDHVDPAVHDRFRGAPGSWGHATRAARVCADAGLAVALSAVPTPDLLRADVLERYADLAEGLGAGWIRVLEPHAAGRWRDRAVALDPAARAALHRWEDDSNTARAHATRPLIVNYARIQDRAGCLSGGDRALYVDTDGRARGCPFSAKVGLDVLDGDLGAAIAALRGQGCARFGAARAFERFGAAASVANSSR